jgi:hypothetical protein
MLVTPVTSEIARHISAIAQRAVRVDDKLPGELKLGFLDPPNPERDPFPHASGSTT